MTDRIEPPPGYEVYEADLSESDDPGWYWDGDLWPFSEGAFLTRELAISAAWTHHDTQERSHADK